MIGTVIDRAMTNVAPEVISEMLLRFRIALCRGPIGDIAFSNGATGAVVAANVVDESLSIFMPASGCAGGRVDLHSEPVELDAELDRIVNIMKPLAERKNIGLFVYPAESGPVSMIVNRQALHQVVSNLVDNAVKFTDQGRVDIRVTTPDDSSIAISVSDTGRGISPDLRHRIFEPFWQADGSVTREANRGVGLGLSIVRLLVEHLGGSTSIDDREDNGTVFTVVLPRDAGSSPG